MIQILSRKVASVCDGQRVVATGGYVARLVSDVWRQVVSAFPLVVPSSPYLCGSDLPSPPHTVLTISAGGRKEISSIGMLYPLSPFENST